MRYFLACFHHTPGNRQVERGQKIVAGPVIDGVRSQLNAFRPLDHHCQTGTIAAVARRAGCGPPADAEGFDCRLDLAIAGGMPCGDGGDLLIEIERHGHLGNPLGKEAACLCALSRKPGQFPQIAHRNFLQDRAKSSEDRSNAAAPFHCIFRRPQLPKGYSDGHCKRLCCDRCVEAAYPVHLRTPRA
ncbi:hypothetical protein D3C87_1512560 [compost metagenome]